MLAVYIKYKLYYSVYDVYLDAYNISNKTFIIWFYIFKYLALYI